MADPRTMDLENILTTIFKNYYPKTSRYSFWHEMVSPGNIMNSDLNHIGVIDWITTMRRPLMEAGWTWTGKKCYLKNEELSSMSLESGLSHFLTCVGTPAGDTCQTSLSLEEWDYLYEYLNSLQNEAEDTKDSSSGSPSMTTMSTSSTTASTATGTYKSKLKQTRIGMRKGPYGTPLSLFLYTR